MYNLSSLSGLLFYVRRFGWEKIAKERSLGKGSISNRMARIAPGLFISSKQSRGKCFESSLKLHAEWYSVALVVALGRT